MTKGTARRWSEEAEETLWGCFKAMNWVTHCGPHADDINAMIVSDRLY